MNSAIDDCKRIYLPQAGSARYCGERITDMSRDELLALCAMMIEYRLMMDQWSVRIYEPRNAKAVDR